MTRNQAAQLEHEINQYPEWHAWPARSGPRGIPLVWFTRKDGQSRTYHAMNAHDFHKVRQAFETKEHTHVHRD